MKVIITAAGLGSRFKHMGIYIPSYKLKIKDKTIYEWSMLSLKDFFNEEFIFIFRTETFDKEFIEDINNKIGIKRYKFKIIDECTEGQAATAFKVDKWIDDNEAVIIYNINTYINPYIISKRDINLDKEIFIPLYNGNNYEMVGFYYFNRWNYFTKIYNKYISYIKIANKEACIEGMIDYFTKENIMIKYKLISREYVYKLDNPQSVKLYNDKIS